MFKKETVAKILQRLQKCQSEYVYVSVDTHEMNTFTLPVNRFVAIACLKVLPEGNTLMVNEKGSYLYLMGW